MILQLSETRRITSDENAFKLQKKIKRDKRGREWKSYRWYHSIGQALSGVSQQLLRESEANGMQEINQVLSHIDDLMEQLQERHA